MCENYWIHSALFPVSLIISHYSNHVAMIMQFFPAWKISYYVIQIMCLRRSFAKNIILQINIVPKSFFSQFRPESELEKSQTSGRNSGIYIYIYIYIISRTNPERSPIVSPNRGGSLMNRLTRNLEMFAEAIDLFKVWNFEWANKYQFAFCHWIWKSKLSKFLRFCQNFSALNQNFRTRA